MPVHEYSLCSKIHAYIVLNTFMKNGGSMSYLLKCSLYRNVSMTHILILIALVNEELQFQSIFWRLKAHKVFYNRGWRTNKSNGYKNQVERWHGRFLCLWLGLISPLSYGLPLLIQLMLKSFRDFPTELLMKKRGTKDLMKKLKGCLGTSTPLPALNSSFCMSIRVYYVSAVLS